MDIDGTLVDDHNQVSNANRAAMHRAIAAGLHIVLATGRRYRTTRLVMDQMALPLPAICLGGALVKDADGAVLHRELFEPPQIAELLAVAHEQRLALLLHRDSHQHGGADFVIDASVPWNEATRHYMDANGHVGQTDAKPNASPRKDVLMVGCFGERKPLEELQRRIERLATLATVLVESKGTPGWYLETTLGHVNKWHALTHYCAARDTPHNAVAAVGDALNDLPMIHGAALGVAMANANEQVREAADWIAPSNNEDGVATLIDRLLAER